MVQAAGLRQRPVTAYCDAHSLAAGLGSRFTKASTTNTLVIYSGRPQWAGQALQSSHLCYQSLNVSHEADSCHLAPPEVA